MKEFQTLRCLTIFAVVLILLATASGVAQTSDTGKGGTLVVLVTRDDVNKTPAEDAYIEVHSFNVNWVAEKSFVLKKVKAGRYEETLPPGIYDVFVSEPTSIPRCRRVLITEGRTGYWSLMLEHDDVYLER